MVVLLMPLTLKQQQFVAEYLIDLNATKAAIRAGYSVATARQQSSRLLTNVDIAQAVAEGAQRRLGKAEITAVRVLEEIRRIAFMDFRSFFDEGGNLKPTKDWTPEQGAVVASVEIIQRRPRRAGVDRNIKYGEILSSQVALVGNGSAGQTAAEPTKVDGNRCRERRPSRPAEARAI